MSWAAHLGIFQTQFLKERVSTDPKPVYPEQALVRWRWGFCSSVCALRNKAQGGRWALKAKQRPPWENSSSDVCAGMEARTGEGVCGNWLSGPSPSGNELICGERERASLKNSGHETSEESQRTVTRCLLGDQEEEMSCFFFLFSFFLWGALIT